jgi:hypothetical protein
MPIEWLKMKLQKMGWLPSGSLKELTWAQAQGIIETWDKIWMPLWEDEYDKEDQI